MPFYEEPVIVRGRSATESFPLFRAYEHPLASKTSKRVFVINMDTRVTSMKRLYEWEKTLRIPYCNEAQLKSDGWFQLGPDDQLFVACLRINQSARRPELDMPKSWLTGIEDLTEAQIKLMDEAQAEALGPKSERTLGKVWFDTATDSLVGGAAIERSARNRDSARAHTIGPTRETPRNVIAPPASGKLGKIGAELDANLLSRAKVITAGASIAHTSMASGPPRTVENMELYSEIHNHLRLGSDSSRSFTTMQLNMCGAQRWVSSMDDMGRVGGDHFDAQDCKGLYTNTISWPDMPDDYEPGLFFLLFAKVYMRMEKHLAVNFSGLHKHGGSAPTAPDGKALEGWETRFVLVSYPQGLAYNGSVRFPMYANPNNLDAIYVTPEMNNPEAHREKFGSVKCANYGRDGLPLTSREAFFNFFSRAMSNQVNYGVLQVDSKLQVQFNVDMFMKCLSYVDDDGQRRTASPWIFAPGWRPKDASRELGQRGEVVDELESTAEFRESGMKRIQKHELYTAQFIPHCVANDVEVTALTDEDVKSLIARCGSSFPTLSVQERVANGISVTINIPSKIQRRSKDHEEMQERDDDEEQERDDDEEQEGGENAGPLASQFHELVNTTENTASLRVKEAKEREKENRKSLKKSLKEQEKGRKGGKRKATESGNSKKQKRRKVERAFQDDARGSPESEEGVIPLQRPRSPSTSVSTPPASHLVIPQNNNRVEENDAETDDPLKGFAILRHLSLGEITRDLNCVRVDLPLRRMGEDGDGDAQEGIRLAEIEVDGLSSGNTRSSCSLLTQAAKVVLKHDQIEVNQAKESLSSRATRIAIVRVCLALGSWLDDCVNKGCDRMFDCAVKDVAADEVWLHSLCKTATWVVSARVSEHTFKTTRYNVLDSYDERYCIVKRRHPYNQDQTSARHVAKEIVLEVLCSWIGLRVERWRLWVLSTIVRHLGTEAASLDGTWTIFKTCSDRQIWRGYVPKYPVEPVGLRCFENALEKMKKSDEWVRSVPLVKCIHTLLTEDGGASWPEQFPTTKDPKDVFLHYIRHSLAVLENTVPPNRASAVQRAIMADPDQRLPFRECIPSLRRMREEGGPYHGDTPRTTRGLFSSIIWRAVTLRSPFADLEQMVFKDLAEWDAYIKKITDKKYIYNPNAYGSATQRHPDKVTGYWESVCALDWETLRDNPALTFMDVFNLLHPIDRSEPRPFNQLGPLGAMHVTSDLAHCGIVPVASNLDIGRCMEMIGSGSANGASIILGRGEDKKLRAELCSKGARVAYDVLNKSLTEDEKRLIRLDDGSMIEHALCKFSGVWNKPPVAWTPN